MGNLLCLAGSKSCPESSDTAISKYNAGLQKPEDPSVFSPKIPYGLGPAQYWKQLDRQGVTVRQYAVFIADKISSAATFSMRAVIGTNSRAGAVGSVILATHMVESILKMAEMTFEESRSYSLQMGQFHSKYLL